MKSYFRSLVERAEGIPVKQGLTFPLRSDIVHEESLFFDHEPKTFSQTAETVSGDARLEVALEPNIHNPRTVEVESALATAPYASTPGSVQTRSAAGQIDNPSKLEPRTEITFPLRSKGARRAENKSPAVPATQRKVAGRFAGRPGEAKAQTKRQKSVRGDMNKAPSTNNKHRAAGDIILHDDPEISQPVDHSEGPMLEPANRPARHEAPVDNPRASEPFVRALEPSVRQVPPVAPPADEPRLIIGQLQVDIVPDRSNETPDITRAPRSAPRPSRAVASSKLRFGLRQM